MDYIDFRWIKFGAIVLAAFIWGIWKGMKGH